MREPVNDDAHADRLYRAGNAVGDWLGLNGWAGVALMQDGGKNQKKFARMIKEAK